MRALRLLLLLLTALLHAELAAALPSSTAAAVPMAPPAVASASIAVPLLACGPAPTMLSTTPVTLASAGSFDLAARKPRPRQCTPYGALCSPTADSCCAPLRCAFDGYAAWCRY